MMVLTNYDEITELLRRHGFHFSKALGQNFLTAAWVPERIAEEAALTAEDGVLEVGPGIGCLTAELAKRAARVTALELDERLREVLAETLSPYPNADVTFADALKTDLRAHCAEKLGDRPWKVCANLPYNVTTPLLTAFLRAECFESITVMIQREVADRLCARPATAEYGAITVLIDWYTEAEKLFEVPPHCFVPQPKVTSEVIQLRRREKRPAEVADEEFFFRVVRAAFAQRRKTLLNALSAGLGMFGKPELAEAIRTVGLPETVRGETLSTQQFAALANELYSRQQPRT